MEEVIVMLILDTLKFFETKSTKCVGKSGCKAIDGFRGRGGWGYLSLKQKWPKIRG